MEKLVWTLECHALIKSGHLGKGLTFRQPLWKSSSELMIKIIMYFLHLCTVRQNVSHNQLTINIFYRGKKINKRRSGFIYSRIKSPDPSQKTIESHSYII